MIILWLCLCLIVALFAAGRGRSGIGYFILSFLLSPLVGGLLVLVLPDLSDEWED